MKLPQLMKTRGAAVLLICLAALGGYFVVRGVQARIRDFENGVQRKSSEIQEEFRATITTMALEHRQYLKCGDVVQAWRAAQNGYQKDSGRYAASLKVILGGNQGQKSYVDDALPDAMKGVCYVIEMDASDTDYRMLFEVDKQALVEQYERELAQEKRARTREHLALRISQLRTADPCRITATEQEVQANGQCGFAVRKGVQ